MSKERRRHNLYEEAKQVFSQESADEFMRYFPPVGWADVATKADLRALDPKFETMNARFEALEARMDKGFAEIRAELHQAAQHSVWDFDDDAFVAGIVAAMQTPLGPDGTDPRLCDLDPARLLDEMRFDLPIRTNDAAVQLSDIADVFDRHLAKDDLVRVRIHDAWVIPPQKQGGAAAAPSGGRRRPSAWRGTPWRSSVSASAWASASSGVGSARSVIAAVTAASGRPCSTSHSASRSSTSCRATRSAGGSSRPPPHKACTSATIPAWPGTRAGSNPRSAP